MSALLECVPNFSDGRDERTVGALVAAMSEVVGIACLGHERDADHNRAVITLAGPAQAVVEAVFRGARQAVECIDLRRHEGVHMRMGAMDVCPFVPLGAAGMELAVDAAHAVGARIGGELGVPVFLYGHAASRDDRRVLGDVRNLGFERLAERVESDDAYAPDYGPRRLHPSAGAVGVGARGLLVAYNVQLSTTELGVAQRIAKRVRSSSGGLPALQARGFPLASRGLVQVSMNLLDCGVTSIRRAFDAVAALAEELGVAVESSELVGLAPASALDAETARHVRLRGDDCGARILETRLRDCGLCAD